jgi:hypothetical protein
MLRSIIAIHRCFVSTALGSIAPSAFPTDGSTVRCPLPSTGSLQVRFPCITSTMRTLRRLAAHLALLRFLHSAITFTACVPPVRSRRRQDASTCGPGISFHR